MSAAPRHSIRSRQNIRIQTNRTISRKALTMGRKVPFAVQIAAE